MRRLLAFACLCAAASAQPSIRVTSARIARIGSPGILDSRVNIDNETDYLTTDPYVYFFVTYLNGHKGDKLHIEWRNPLGEVAQEVRGDGGDGSNVWFWSLNIAGAPAAFSPGEWQVRLYVNDRPLTTMPFRISLPPDSALQFASPTLFPEAVVGEPYFLQLTVRRGSPPYRWSEQKPLPAGLKLSPEGLISGTPEQRGGFRAVLKAEDSAGNSITRAVGIGVGIPAERAKPAVVSLSVSSAPANDAAGCTSKATAAEFSPSNARIALAVLLDTPAGSGNRPDGRIEWLNPRGERVQDFRFHKEAGEVCIANALEVAGKPPASDPGEWRVRLFWRENLVLSSKFVIKGGAATTATTTAGGRTAILVTNRKYQKLPAAGPPDADVARIAATLREGGFQVTAKADLTLEDLRALEKDYATLIHDGDTVFVYFSGHQIPSAGDTWLAPVNYDPADPRPIQSKAYSVQRLRDVLEDRKAKLSFLVVDAAPQGTGKGLDAGAADDNTTIVLSGGPRTGAFARALAETLSKPGTAARPALDSDLAPAVARLDAAAPKPVTLWGGGAAFVFHAPGVAGRRPGETRVNPKDGQTYAWIPPGVFRMGCSPADPECKPLEMPAHPVRIGRGFWLGATEVTVEAWRKFSTPMPAEPVMGRFNLNPGWADGKLPMVNISWSDAKNFCEWAGGRLPTEAEWEYAARAGTEAARYAPLDDIAWVLDNSGKDHLDGAALVEGNQNVGQRAMQNGNRMHPVASKRPNAWGLFDMLGNVWEWVADWLGDATYYAQSPELDPRGPASGRGRVHRGGAWFRPAVAARASERVGNTPDYRNTFLGARCAMEDTP